MRARLTVADRGVGAVLQRAGCRDAGAGAAQALLPLVLLHVGAAVDRGVRRRGGAVRLAVHQQRWVLGGVLSDAGGDVGVGGQAGDDTARVDQAACAASYDSQQ